MPTFLNLSLDGKINTNFLLKHLLFSAFWIIGILLFIFRIDILLIENYSNSLQWLKVSLPTLYFLCLIISFFFLRWYYIIAFFFYPLILIFWIIPKTVLSKGKIYLFGNYLTAIFSKLVRFKQTIAHLFLLILSIILLVTISGIWTRWLAIFVMSYFYLRYVFKLLKKSFKQPSLFGEDLEEKIKAIIQKNNPEDSFVIKSFIHQKDDEKLELTERREKHIRRSIIANHVIDQLTNKINGFKGRKAFIISWIYSAFTFLFYSVIFFWFLNIQLFKIDVANFAYNGSLPSFDFFYYTLKTITFGDIELVKPISVLARVSEISSFFIIGIFLLVIFVSVFLSIRQDKMNENVKLTTDLFQSENLTLTKYFKDEFGMELKSAMNEVKNIDDSLKNLRNIINQLF